MTPPEAAVTVKEDWRVSTLSTVQPSLNISYYYPIRLLPEKQGLGMSFGSRLDFPEIATDYARLKGQLSPLLLFSRHVE